VSTRCNIKITDGCDTLWLYRHSDGYPSCVKPILVNFLEHVKDGIIRDNVEQATGWLIIYGAAEYNGDRALVDHVPTKEGYSGWKVGAFEPATGQHGDIEYLYHVNLKTKELRVLKPD